MLCVICKAVRGLSGNSVKLFTYLRTYLLTPSSVFHYFRLPIHLCYIYASKRIPWQQDNKNTKTAIIYFFYVNRTHMRTKYKVTILQINRCKLP